MAANWRTSSWARWSSGQYASGRPAWLGLINEHTRFGPDPRTGPLAWVEAGRCLHLYPNNRALAWLAAATWLPYGDLYHYAYSTHPSVGAPTKLPRHIGELSAEAPRSPFGAVSNGGKRSPAAREQISVVDGNAAGRRVPSVPPVRWN
ncbi:hypothetical protein [Streptomyces sp. NPDC101455]|uniref:hypothetical protein n=1 Tax=Streptomyces sp. NPDC101455 TaxID=3366142 RepID=UPI0037FEA66F